MKIIILVITLFISLIAFSHDEGFSGWVNHADLDNYFFVLNNGGEETNFFEKVIVLLLLRAAGTTTKLSIELHTRIHLKV